MPTSLTPQAVLERHFGFREFLDGQERVIQSVLAGDDTLVVMPTGGGCLTLDCPDEGPG